MKRTIKESANDITIDEIESMYGVEVRKALEKYCSIKRLSPDEVVNDTMTDGNGQTEWDKFDNWAEKKLGLDIMGKFDTDDDYDWTGADTARKEEDDWESDHRDEFVESFDEPENEVDEGFIVNWIGEELYGCEWIDSDEIKFYPDEAVEISTRDGDVYRISVNKIFSSKLGSYLDER